MGLCAIEAASESIDHGFQVVVVDRDRKDRAQAGAAALLGRSGKLAIGIDHASEGVAAIYLVGAEFVNHAELRLALAIEGDLEDRSGAVLAAVPVVP